MRLDSVIEEFDNQRTLGQELLTPTRIYAKDCLDLITETDVRALAHITGGGIPGNLVRVLPEHVDAVVDRSTWRPQPIFDLVQRKGRIEQAEMESTFNMGVGMMAIVAAGRRRPGAGVPARPRHRRLGGRRGRRRHRPGADARLPHSRLPSLDGPRRRSLILARHDRRLSGDAVEALITAILAWSRE